MHDHLRRLFEYEEWANRTEVDHLRGLPNAPLRAINLLAHIVGTQWLFYSRLRGESSPMMVWPTLGVDECAAHLERLHEVWLPVLDTAQLDRTIEYTNSKDERWTSSVADVLTHVVLHGSYHRGQIALLVRDGGETPAYTDYIECTRRAFI